MARTRSVPKSKKKLGGAKDEQGHRVDKVAAVQALADSMRTSSAFFLTEYRGMSVNDLADLRVALGKQSAQLKIAKNTLATIAAKQAGIDGLEAMLQGPTALAFASGDAVLAAKEINDFAKRQPLLVLKGAVLEGQVFDAEGAKAIASLESREVMLSRVAGLFKASLQQAANLFAAPLNKLGAGLAQYKDKLAGSGEAA